MRVSGAAPAAGVSGGTGFSGQPQHELRPPLRRLPEDRSDQRRDIVFDAKQSLAVEFVADRRQHDGMP
jgi:hypothetical protein